MSNPFSVRDPSISHTKVENALLPKEGDDGSNFVLYVDNVNKRLGINHATPEQAIDCLGYIQLRSTGVQRLILYDDAGDHINADIGGAVDGTNGGFLGFITKVDGGIDTEKLRINNIGAVGIGGANFGTAGSVLTSNGSGSPVSWNSPYSARVFCNVDTNSIPENVSTKIINFALDTSTTTSNATSDLANNSWTPPAGIYQVNGQVGISRVPGGGIYSMRFEIMKNGSSIRMSRTENENNSSGQDIIFSTLNICDIIYANGTDVIDFTTMIQIAGTGGSYSVRANSTFFSVYKIG